MRERRKPLSEEFARQEAHRWLLNCYHGERLTAIDETCHIIMSHFARPAVRFDTPDACIFINAWLRNEGRPEIPWSEHNTPIYRSLLFLWDAGWIKQSIHRRELLAHYRFTTEGIRQWEDVQRPIFLANMAVQRPVWEARKAEAERAEREAEAAAAQAEREAEYLKRFGVKWDVHEDGIREWDY